MDRVITGSDYEGQLTVQRYHPTDRFGVGKTAPPGMTHINKNPEMGGYYS